MHLEGTRVRACKGLRKRSCRKWRSSKWFGGWAAGVQVLRQTVVPKSMPWTAGVVRLLDSACGVRDRYNAFMAMLAVKSGGEFLSAPLKGLFRLSEKLWLRPTHNPEPQKPFFQRGDSANVFDVVRGMIVCANMDELNICLGLLAACDANQGTVTSDGDVTAAQAAGIEEEIHVLRVKNRFKLPTPSGWADLLIKFVGMRARWLSLRAIISTQQSCCG